jgi:hypothetical protein
MAITLAPCSLASSQRRPSATLRTSSVQVRARGLVTPASYLLAWITSLLKNML